MKYIANLKEISLKLKDLKEISLKLKVSSKLRKCSEVVKNLAQELFVV